MSLLQCLWWSDDTLQYPGETTFLLPKFHIPWEAQLGKKVT